MWYTQVVHTLKKNDIEDINLLSYNNCVFKIQQHHCKYVIIHVCTRKCAKQRYPDNA